MANNNWIPAAVGGGIVAVVLDEIFSVGPRVKTAEDRGYSQGWWQRDAQLQPIIADLHRQIADFRNIALNQQRAIGRVEGVLATLLAFAQEFTKLVKDDKVDKKQLQDLIQTKLVNPLKELSGYTRELRLGLNSSGQP